MIASGQVQEPGDVVQSEPDLRLMDGLHAVKGVVVVMVKWMLASDLEQTQGGAVQPEPDLLQVDGSHAVDCVVNVVVVASVLLAGKMVVTNVFLGWFW